MKFSKRKTTAKNFTFSSSLHFLFHIPTCTPPPPPHTRTLLATSATVCLLIQGLIDSTDRLVGVVIRLAPGILCKKVNKTSVKNQYNNKPMKLNQYKCTCRSHFCIYFKRYFNACIYFYCLRICALYRSKGK